MELPELPKRCGVCREQADTDLCAKCEVLVDVFDRDPRKLRRAANVLERSRGAGLLRREAGSLRIEQT